MSKILVDKGVLEQALEALEDYKYAEARVALRAALAEEALQRLTDVHQEMERKPLTEEEIHDLLEAEFLGRDGKRSWDDDLQVFRLAERAHRIGQ